MAAPPEKEPEHSGLRPLSPYGEGYCRWCHFVVGLDYAGMLAQHFRGAHGLTARQGAEAKPCGGSGTRPPKVTPHASRKAAFRAVARKEQCHVCKRETVLLADGRLSSHSRDPYRLNDTCAGGYRFPERDHSGERG